MRRRNRPMADNARQFSVIAIGPKNCVATLGIPWRRAKEFAAARGLEPMGRIGRAKLYDAQELMAAAREAVRTEAEPSTALASTPADPAEEIRRRLGLRRRPL